jgi:hypothetical protein
VCTVEVIAWKWIDPQAKNYIGTLAYPVVEDQWRQSETFTKWRCLFLSGVVGLRFKHMSISSQFHTDSDQHLSEIYFKSMNIWSRGGLGSFWFTGLVKDDSGTCPGRFPGTIWSCFGSKCHPKGAFLEIPKIENGTKTARWRQDRHRDRLKMLFLDGSDKYMKNR